MVHLVSCDWCQIDFKQKGHERTWHTVAGIERHEARWQSPPAVSAQGPLLGWRPGAAPKAHLQPGGRQLLSFFRSFFRSFFVL